MKVLEEMKQDTSSAFRTGRASNHAARFDVLRRLLATFIVATGLFACSDEPSSGGGDDAAAADAKFCQAEFDLETQCGNMPPSTEVAECTSKEVCRRNLFRPDALTAVRTCLVERDCMAFADACYGEVAQAQPDTASSTAFGAACMPRLAECAMEGSGFLDDYCYSYEIIQDGVLDKMTACLSQPCPMISDCLSGTVNAILDPCGGK